MNTMYSDQPAHQRRSIESKAAQWTPAAQQKYAELSSLPDDAQRTVRMELGYLNEAKQAAEELSRKAN